MAIGTECKQLPVLIEGEVKGQVVQSSLENRFLLTPTSPALLVPAGFWFSQTYISEDAVLLVLASEPYHPDAMLHDPHEAWPFTGIALPSLVRASWAVPQLSSVHARGSGSR